MKVLVIAPHADDELFGCGGTLLKLKRAGHEIKCVLVACDKINMRHIGYVSAETRAKEFEESCLQLSTAKPFIMYMKDSMLDCEPISNLVTKLDQIIAEFEPNLMFIPEPSYHQDHQYVYQACIASLRPTKSKLPNEVLAYEVPTSTWNGLEQTFKPNVFYELTEEDIEEKTKVFTTCYLSQVAQECERGALSVTSIKTHALYRGIEANVSTKYAEAFALLRSVK